MTGRGGLTAPGGLLFAWRLDGGEFTGFTSATTATLTGLMEGTHSFEVKARDQAGNDDPTPASLSFALGGGLGLSSVSPASGPIGSLMTIPEGEANRGVDSVTASMPWPWGCPYWPGRIECGTWSAPPASICFSAWIKIEQNINYCGGNVPGMSQIPGPTSQAGQDLPGADPVDLATGIFMLSKTDLALPGVMPLAVTRTYRSGDTFPGPFGLGTTLGYEDFLEQISPTVITYLYRANARTEFTQQPDGTFTTDTVPAFRGTRITANTDGTYTLRHKDGGTIGFDSQGQQVARRDRHGNTVTIGRTPNTTVGTITGPTGGGLTFTWQGSRVSQVTDSAGRTVRYAYDTGGRLVAVTDAAGGVTSYAYDSTHRLTTITDARGILFLQNTYDGNSRVCRQQQADAGVFTLYYVTADHATTAESVLLLQEAEAGGAISQGPCTAAASTGRVVATVLLDPRGHPTTRRFNTSGVLIQTTDALGQATTYTREPASHLLLATTDALGRQTTSTYDAQGNVLTVTRLAGTAQAVTTTVTYEPTYNQVATVTDALTHTTSFGYDAAGTLTSVTNPLSQSTTLTSNAAGQPLTITDALSHTVQLGYGQGNLATITDPTGAVTSRVSDGAGRLTSVTTPLGARTGYAYDALNQLTAITDPLGGLTQFSYDANGNLLRLVDALNHATVYTPDPMDRVATRTDPLGRAESFGYDLNGNLTTVTDRKGQVASATYDALNRRTQLTYADGSSTTYTWDAGDRLIQIVDSLSGTIARTYDGLDRLTQETTPQGTVSYAYDAAGRRTSMTVAGQPAVTYGYDDADRLSAIAQGAQSVSSAYDAASRRTSRTLPNGVVTEYAYDAASRLTGLTYRHGADVLGTVTYTYDAGGHRSGVGGTWARTALPQALPATTYEAANEQQTFGSTPLTYDLNGNLTGDGTTTYTWDARNRLASVSGPSITAAFQYDPRGRRTRKTVNSMTTDFLYDGLNPVQELAGGVPVANLLTGLAIDEVFTRTGGAGAHSFLTDAQQSTIALSDSAGTIATEYTYEPFGASTLTGAPADNPFQYTGRENDATGLYYYRARYYHPGLQRFIAEDPVGFAAGDPNLYSYVANSPINSRDPFGLRTVSLGTTVGAAIGFGGGGGTFVNVGHDPTQGWLSGWSLSVTGTAAAGAVAGAGATVGISLSVSTASDVSGLRGTFYEAGRGGLGRTGAGYFESPDRSVQGGTVSISLTGGSRGYLGVSVGASTTSALVQWIQGRSLSLGATDGASIVTIPLGGTGTIPLGGRK